MSQAFSSATGAAAKAPLLLLLCNVPLFILDHVHFQYNSVVLSLLVLTAAFAETRQYLKTAVAYSLLISMKVSERRARYSPEARASTGHP